MFWGNVGSGIVANVLFLLGLFMLGTVCLYLFRRREVFKFFGLAKTRRLTIYLSALVIPWNTAAGFDGVVRSYQGFAILINEYMVGEMFKGLFNYLLPNVVEGYGIFRKLLVSDTQVTVQASPLSLSPTDTDDSKGTVITVGGPGYNSVSHWVQNTLHSKARFTDQGIVIADERTISHGLEGFVERLIDSTSGRHIYYVAGRSESATLGALYYLCKRWKHLNATYGTNNPFVHTTLIDNSGDWRTVTG